MTTSYFLVKVLHWQSCFLKHLGQCLRFLSWRYFLTCAVITGFDFWPPLIHWFGNFVLLEKKGGKAEFNFLCILFPFLILFLLFIMRSLIQIQKEWYSGSPCVITISKFTASLFHLSTCFSSCITVFWSKFESYHFISKYFSICV